MKIILKIFGGCKNFSVNLGGCEIFFENLGGYENVFKILGGVRKYFCTFFLERENFDFFPYLNKNVRFPNHSPISRFILRLNLGISAEFSVQCF